LRLVDLSEWNLSGMKDLARAARLLHPLAGEQLISAVAEEAEAAARRDLSSWRWQRGEEMDGCCRGIATFPLARDTFDALFNGRSGYRAQYYLSCKDGIHFNNELLKALMKPLALIYQGVPAEEFVVLERSFVGPYSKIWVLGDGASFRVEPENEFMPKRWVENNLVSLGLRAPLPDPPTVEVKGSWITNTNHEYREDADWKGDRHSRLSKFGFV
jgi:hypothetical protein